MTQTIIINDKIHLTEVRESDKTQLCKLANNEKVFNNTLLIPFPYTTADADWFVNHCRETEAQSGQILNFAIRNQEGTFIGGCGVRLDDYIVKKHKGEIGYWLGEPYWGQGIGTTMVRGLTDYLFNNTGLTRITANTFEHNIASQKVLLKVGFEREGFARKFYVKPANGLEIDVVMFAKIKS
jgi:[ribosomal protein S5]-alanine N-acetyltransferase